MILSLVLSGCKQDKPTLHVYNWGDYIDESILEEFEKEMGIKVVYDTFATNEDMYVKIKSGGSSYDIIFPSDYMLTRMREEDMLEKIDLDKIPNHKYLESRFMGTEFDPNNEYSLPYMWGTMGMKLGYSLNTLDPQELTEAGNLLKQQKPLVLAYVVDEGKDKMVAGEAALALTWSGEAAYAREENEDLAYAIPKEGTNIWFDVMAIPKGAKNKDGALKFMDFLHRPDISLRNAEYTGYATPNSAAKVMLPEEVRNDLGSYPEEEDLVNAEVFVNLGRTLKEYDRIWTEVKAH